MDVCPDLLLKNCLQLVTSNAPLNILLKSLLDYILVKSRAVKGFISEKIILNKKSIIRYHVITSLDAWKFTAEELLSYQSNNYIDFLEVDVKERFERFDRLGHFELFTLKININENFTVGLYTDDLSIDNIFKETCAYILQLAIERSNIVKYKNCFLTNISNAIKPSIDGILNISKLTSNLNLSHTQKHYFDLTTIYSMKLLDIINDIQDYTRLSMKSLHLINKTMNIRECINAVLMIVQHKVSSSVALTFNLEDDIPDIIIGDEIRIIQILVNLLGNACKFTKEGTITMTIKAKLDFKNNNWIFCFIIADSGVGMNEDQVLNIFNEIKPSSNNMNESIKLGLLIVKKLLELLDGDIIIFSTPLKGTCVTVTLTVGHRTILTPEQIKEKFIDEYVLVHNYKKDKFYDYGIKTFSSGNVKEAVKYLKNKSLKFNMIFLYKTSEEDLKAINKVINSGTIVYIKDKKEEIHDIEQEPYYILTPLTTEKISDVLLNIITDRELAFKQINIKKYIKGRVLIAEDDSESANLLTKYLKKLGYTDIDYVPDGLELYLKLTGCSVDYYKFVFVNINISILDGITAIKRFNLTNQSDKISNMIIIAVSTTMTAAIKDQCYSAGMKGYIIKPINMKDLERMEVMLINS